MAIYRKKMSFDAMLDHVGKYKKLQEQKRIIAVLERTARILREMKEQLANRDIRITVPEILPKKELLCEIKLLAGQLELEWESYHKSISRPKAA